MKYIFNAEPIDVITIIVLLENKIKENEKKSKDPNFKPFEEFIKKQNESYKKLLKIFNHKII